MALLLVSCAKEYNDAELRNRVTTLETKIGNLEAQMKAVQTVALGQYVQKVEQTAQGVTVTYGNGDVVTLNISATPSEATGVLSVMKNAAGELCWAIDGKILQVDGKDLTLYQTPKFEVKNGHLYVTVGGKTTDLGEFAGSSVQDGLIKDIKKTDTMLVITLNDNSTIEIPLMEAFRLVIAKTQYAVTSTDPIEIPYTVQNKTQNTVVDVFTDANFDAAVDAQKITITPLAVVKGKALAYADSQVGFTSIVKLTFGAEAEPDYATITDQPYSETIDYLGEAKDGVVEVHVVSNASIDVKSEADWITVQGVKATNYTVTLALADNPTTEIRTGVVKVYSAGTTNVLQTITVAQKAGEPEPAEPDQELYGKVFELTPELSENFLFEGIELANSTIEWRFFPRSWHEPGMPNRLGGIENRSEQGIMLRFSNGSNAGKGQLHLSASAMLGGEPQVTKEGETKPYIFEAEKWHTLSIVCDGTNMSVYDNGVYINKYALKNPTLKFERIEFGMSWDDGSWNNTGYSTSQLFDGYIDYVRVWSVARSASEVKAGLCNVDNKSEGLVAYWRFQNDSDFDGSFLVNRTGDAKFDINWAEMSEMDGSNVRKTLDLSDAIKAAVKTYDGNLCAGTGSGK